VYWLVGAKSAMAGRPARRCVKWYLIGIISGALRDAWRAFPVSRHCLAADEKKSLARDRAKDCGRRRAWESAAKTGASPVVRGTQLTEIRVETGSRLTSVSVSTPLSSLACDVAWSISDCNVKLRA
jgi:hypothetical protein